MKKIVSALILCLVSIVSFGQNPIPDEPFVITSGGLVPTVQIGNQGWMKECLKVQTDSLGNILETSNNEFQYHSSYDVSTHNEFVIINGNYYYRYDIADDICPCGWRLPSNSDYINLQMNVISDTSLYDWQNNYWLKALCDTISWIENDILGSPGYQMSTNNQSNFSIIPNGCSVIKKQPSNNSYWIIDIGDNSNGQAYYWTSDGYIHVSSRQSQINYSVNVGGIYYYQVRCIKNTPVYDNVDKITDLKEINIYPNPTRNLVTVEAENLQQISVFNLIGQKIMESTVSGNIFECNMGHYAAGIYMMQIETANIIATKCIVVK